DDTFPIVFNASWNPRDVTAVASQRGNHVRTMQCSVRGADWSVRKFVTGLKSPAPLRLAGALGNGAEVTVKHFGIAPQQCAWAVRVSAVIGGGPVQRARTGAGG